MSESDSEVGAVKINLIKLSPPPAPLKLLELLPGQQSLLDDTWPFGNWLLSTRLVSLSSVKA